MSGPEELVLTVGSPVLIASPYDSDFSAQQVIVAWKDTRKVREDVSDGSAGAQGSRRGVCCCHW